MLFAFCFTSRYHEHDVEDDVVECEQWVIGRRRLLVIDVDPGRCDFAFLQCVIEGVLVEPTSPKRVLVVDDSEMLRDGLSRRPHPEGPDGNLNELRLRTPLLSIAAPTEIAQSVLFLADSDRSAYITGQSLIADGGATARLSTE